MIGGSLFAIPPFPGGGERDATARHGAVSLDDERTAAPPAGRGPLVYQRNAYQRRPGTAEEVQRFPTPPSSAVPPAERRGCRAASDGAPPSTKETNE